MVLSWPRFLYHGAFDGWPARPDGLLQLEVSMAKGGDYAFPRDTTAQTKSGVLNALSSATGLPRQHVGKVVGALAALAAIELARRGAFTMPGMAKMKVVKKAATKARQGINPFTKQPTIFKAKPARKLVKIRPLKALKDSLK
jgi:nucleoid DNA-binding protein